MKNKWIAILLAAAVGFAALVGCTGDNGTEDEVYAATLAPDSSRNTTVTIESTLTGSHVCRVYLNNSFAYQQTITLE